MAEPEDAVVLVMTTLGDGPTAERLVETLVEERLIACGNILPGVSSIYRWQGTISRESELMVMMKTRKRRLDALLARAAALHPYEVPELLAISVDGGSESYRRWVQDETSEVSA